MRATYGDVKPGDWPAALLVERCCPLPTCERGAASFGCRLSGSLAVVLWLCRLRAQAHGSRHPLRWGWRYSWFASARAGFGSHISPGDDTAQCFGLLFPLLEFRLYGVERLPKQPVGYHRFIQVHGSILIRDVGERQPQVPLRNHR
ncbi:hypothetical protein XENOCAPTIV_028608 [Xenoophorus captivus]|uniref:Uncharacterized protein n=1 Tax=Xenoophorus captivus TaxID=1517983 RepID=A0ABV0R295_9TELE